MGGTRRVPLRPRRLWLWAGLGLLAVLAVLVGAVLRAGTRGAGPEVLMLGAVGAAAALLLVGEVVVVLQAVQAREAADAALTALPAGHRVAGRIRIRGSGRPVLIDHVVVSPRGDVWAVTVDGSANPPRPGDPTDGLAALLPTARRAADALARAAQAGVLPPELGLGPRPRVRPCILAARRPLQRGPRQGVLAFSAAEAAEALGGESEG